MADDSNWAPGAAGARALDHDPCLCKRVPSFNSLADELRKAIFEVLAEVGHSAVQSLASAPPQPMLQRILSLLMVPRALQTKDARLFNDVRSYLETLAKTIEYVRFWYGTQQHDKEIATSQTDRSSSVSGDLEASLKAKKENLGSHEAQAALKAAASVLHQSEMDRAFAGERTARSPRMSQASRRHHTPAQKAELLRQHHLKKIPISDLCNQNHLQPSVFYRWQHQLFERAHVAFVENKGPSRREQQLEQRLSALEARLARKDSIIAAISEEYVVLKNQHGGR